MDGTIPLIIHVPANEPINNNIIRAPIADDILLIAPFNISSHLTPKKVPNNAAIAAENNKVN